MKDRSVRFVSQESVRGDKCREVKRQRLADEERRRDRYSRFDVGGAPAGAEAVSDFGRELRGIIAEGLGEKRGGY